MYYQLKSNFEFTLVDADSELDYKAIVCKIDSPSKNKYLTPIGRTTERIV